MPPSDESKSVDSTLDFLQSASGSELKFSNKRTHLSRNLLLIAAVLPVSLWFVLYALFWKAPAKFPTGITITVETGMTIQGTAELLLSERVIRSPFWFKVWSVFFGGNLGIKAGSYYLPEPASIVRLAQRFTHGTQNIVPLRVTLPEGLSNLQIAALLSKSLPGFDRRGFLEQARKSEGYLFPDTYTFFPNVTPEKVIEDMKQNFMKRITPLQEKIKEFGRPLHDVLTMASLIEGEARTLEVRKEISSILWRRLDLGMPLQVDAVFPYILGKNTYQVTSDDLKYDSPYNTYLYVGLPPGPINNPSLDAIAAAVTPAETKYLYYLSDNDGQMHYATSHPQHLINRAKYLGK